jgi:flavorubredoxin
MSEKKKVVFVVYYSMYGHLQSLAREICLGLEKSGGNEIFSKFFISSFVSHYSLNLSCCKIIPSSRNITTRSFDKSKILND